MLHEALSHEGGRKTEAGDQLPSFDANGRPIHLLWRLNLVVHVGKCRVAAGFIVCERFHVLLVLGTDFTSRHVRGIICMDNYVEVKDGSRATLNGSTGNEANRKPADASPTR